MAEASIFKFDTQVWFAKAHHKIAHRAKSGRSLGLQKSPKHLGFFFNRPISASDFKFGTQIGFAKDHHKITPRGKTGRGLGLWKLPKMLGYPLIFVQVQRPCCPLSVNGVSC